MRWSKENERDLATLWRRGESVSHIADALGPKFTRNMVIGKAHRMGLGTHPSQGGDINP